MKGKNYPPKSGTGHHSFLFLANRKKEKRKGKSLGALPDSQHDGLLELTPSCNRNVAGSHAGTAEKRTVETSARQQEAMSRKLEMGRTNLLKHH